jgi:peptide/nickel transport system permease protein
MRKTVMVQLGRFLVMRFIMAVATLVIVSFIVFSLMELSPVAYFERCWSIMPLDAPYMTRWVDWLANVLIQGDFGQSCILRKSINALLGTKFWVSLGICLSSLLLAYLIALPIGVYSATGNSRALNNLLRFVSYLGLSVPNFLFALIILLIWSNFYGETLTGLFSREHRDADWSYARLVDFLSHVWLPVIALGWSATAFAMQSVRALVADEFGKPYVMAARARGVSGQQLLWRYPARHAMGPVINSLGFDLNRVFNELPIVAVILSITDAGALLFEALVRSKDQPLAAAILFLLTATIIAMNLLTDILLAALDPRFRQGILGRP